MTTAVNPASPWLFPGQLAGEHRSYRRLVRVLDQLGIPARASRLAGWRELARQAPPAILADALGVSAETAMRHAFLGGADWSVYADGIGRYFAQPLARRDIGELARILDRLIQANQNHDQLR
jgi:hypothetical protein